MNDLETIYYAYRDAETWIEKADQKIKELEANFGNKDVIKSVYEHNKLLRLITSNLAHFFEETEEEGTADFHEIVPLEDIKKYTEDVISFV